MTKQEAENRRRFIDLINKEAGRDVSELSGLLLRHGPTYARFQEMNCNGVGTWHGESNESFARRQDRFERKLEKRESLMEKRITAICALIGAGFVPRFEGDPRGHTIKIRVPSGYQNSGDNAGEGGVSVPTS